MFKYRFYFSKQKIIFMYPDFFVVFCSRHNKTKINYKMLSDGLVRVFVPAVSSPASALDRQVLQVNLQDTEEP